MKRIYWKPIAISATTIIALLSVGAASATFLPGGMGNEWQQWVLTQLETPFAKIQSQLEQADAILNTILQGSWGENWSDQIGSIAQQPPDPYRLRTSETALPAGVLATNPVVQKRDAANLYDQELGRSIAAPVLGETGRNWIEQTTQQTDAIVQNNQQGLQVTQQLAQEAQSLTSTQDVVKHNAKGLASLAGIVTNHARLSADHHTALLKLQQLQGTVAQLSANTSEGIDEANRRDRITRQIELSSATRTELYIPGLYNTQPNTQSD